MTVCAAGGGPIAYDPWLVTDDDGEVPMCEPHAVIVDFGRDMVAALGAGHPLVVRLVAVLDEIMGEPCPLPGVKAVEAVDALPVPASDEPDELATDLARFAPFLVAVDR